MKNVLELGPFGDLQDEIGVGGGVLWMILLNQIEISSVSNDETVLFHSDELVLPLHAAAFSTL